MEFAAFCEYINDRYPTWGPMAVSIESAHRHLRWAGPHTAGDVWGLIKLMAKKKGPGGAHPQLEAREADRRRERRHC